MSGHFILLRSMFSTSQASKWHCSSESSHLNFITHISPDICLRLSVMWKDSGKFSLNASTMFILPHFTKRDLNLEDWRSDFEEKQKYIHNGVACQLKPKADEV